MKEREWADFQAKYESLLSFIDVFYSAMLGVGLILLGLILDHYFDAGGLDWAPLILLAFAILYLVGDYIDSRLFTEEYPYKGLTRFIIDLLIGFVFFCAFVTGYHASPYFLLTMAVAFFLGGVWCVCLQWGVARVKPLRFWFPVAAGHVTAAVIFAHLWSQHRWQHKLYVPDALKAVEFYFAWAICYVGAEVMLNMPSKEADLLPNFPVGRIARNLKFIKAARQRLFDSGILIIGACLHKINSWTEDAAIRWDRFAKSRSLEESGSRNPNSSSEVRPSDKTERG